MNLDFNAMYSSILSDFLPIRNYKWVENVDEWNTQKILDFDLSGKISYIFEVDVEIGIAQHDTFRKIPFFYEKMVYPISPNSKTKKLIGTLYNQHNYVLHISLLEVAL